MIRKFSDGEFCTADHRALFERLNNDLGLQRLMASQSNLSRQQIGHGKQQEQPSAPESKAIMLVPPLSRIVNNSPQQPVAARHVNQPGLPVLLGPGDSAVPQAGLRARIPGLPAPAGLNLEPVAQTPVGPWDPATPEPLPALDFPAVAPEAWLPLQPAAGQEPPRGESLFALPVGACAPSLARMREIAPAGAWCASAPEQPRLHARVRPPRHEEGAAPATAARVGEGVPEPPFSETLAGVGASAPCGRAVAPPLGFDPGVLVREELAAPSRSWGAVAACELRRPGQVAMAAGACGAGRVPPRTASPLGNRIEPVGPRLACTVESERALETPPAIVFALRPLPAGLLPARSTAIGPMEQAPGLPAATCEALALPAVPGLAYGNHRALAAAPLEVLPVWRVPALEACAIEPQAARIPQSTLRPEVPTASEALELEVMSCEVAQEESDQSPPFQEAQRSFGVLRPLSRDLAAAHPSESALASRWGMALETAAFCPRLRFRIDHADGSGSRAARVEWRPRTKKDLLWGVHERIPGGRFWRSAPADLKWIALALPVILALVVWSFRGSVAPVEASLPSRPDASKTVIAQQMGKFQQVLLSRAAVRLYDDFRGGLGAWQGRDEWARTWKYNEASFLEPGDLALYAPTIEMRDYSVEFLGQIERKSLNWVFRAKDTQNYYAMRIVLTRGGPLPSGALIRYTVINGRESNLVTLPLPLSIRADTVYRVRMEVVGERFTTYVQGQVVDSFDDGRLRAGGIGFWSPRGDRSLLRWVEVMHQYDYLGRLCALLSPYPLQAGGQQAD